MEARVRVGGRTKTPSVTATRNPRLRGRRQEAAASQTKMARLPPQRRWREHGLRNRSPRPRRRRPCGFVAHSGTPRQGGRGNLPSLDRCRADADVKGAALVDAECLGHRDGRARTRRLRWRRQDRSGILLSSYRQLESARVRQRLRERCDHRVGVGVGHRRARRLRRREDRPGGLPRRHGPMDDAPVECGLRDNRHIRSWHTN